MQYFGPTSGIRDALRQLRHFVAYVARHYPLFYPILVLTLFVLVSEYAATSLMIPLSGGGHGGQAVGMSLWTRLLASMELAPTTRTWLWLFFLVMIARLLLGYVQAVATTYLGKQVHRRMGHDVFSQVTVHESLQAVYARTPGYYITLAGDDTFRCGTIIASLLQSSVSLLTTFVAMFVLFQFSPIVFGYIAVFLLLSIAGVALLFRRILRLNTQGTAMSRDLSTTFIEALNSLRSIRALHAQRFVSDSYTGELSLYCRILFRIDALKTATKSLPAALLLIIAAVLLRPGSNAALDDATLFAGTIIVVRLFAALGLFVTSGSLLLTDIRSVHDIDSLVRRSEAPPDTKDAVSPTAATRIDSISLEGVRFGYKTEAPIFRGASITLRRGLSYAVVGQSGTGKSTMADLLLGLVRPDAGLVAVNQGMSLDAAGPIRGVLVEQHTKLFSGSLRENLQLGMPCSDDQLWEALHCVDLAEPVRTLRDGLDTRISYQGDNFSGGQRQRIGIARALLRRPDLLIMDEATSALDPHTAGLVLANVRRLMHEGILVLITHDGNVAQSCDVRITLDAANAPGTLVASPVSSA